MKIRVMLAFLALALPALGDLPPDRPYDALDYKIRWSVDPARNPNTFQATTTATVKAKRPLETVELDIAELKIARVSLKKPAKSDLAFAVKNDKILEVKLPRSYPKGTTVVLEVEYEGKIRSEHTGLFKVTDPDEPERGPLFFTQFESRDARSFFPCNDQPADKATTEVVTAVPERFEVLSNGVRSKDRFFKKDGERWKEVRWRLNQPQSTYLVAVAVAPFARLQAKHGKKAVDLWLAKGKADKGKYVLEATRKMLPFFETYLGVPYPWPRYDTVAVPTFLWGGMENTSVTFMNQERITLNDPNSELEKKGIVGLAAHELAHQWFGDYVTMAWWDDLWLNEAFASYLGTLATLNHFKSEEPEMDVVISTWDNYFREEDGPRSHPIVNKDAAEPDDSFDSISYTKGENVLRMLHHYIGDKAFRKGLTAYLKAHAYGNATYLDFFEHMERASGSDLASFRDTWLLQRGYPVITYGGSWDGEKKVYRLTVKQASNHAEDKSLFHFRLPVVFHRKSTPAYSKTITLTMGEAEREETVALTAEPEWITVNPGAVVLGRVVPAARDEGRIAAQALGDPDPIARVWAAFELARGLLEGGNVSSFAERALLQVLRADNSPYVRVALLGAFVRMKRRWLPEALGNGIYTLAREAQGKNYEQAATVAADPHGWSQWRSTLLAAAGKVNHETVLPFLGRTLARPDISLDELRMAARGIAAQGSSQSAGILRASVQLHEKRGYRYRYWIQYAFGYYETPEAAKEIADLAKTAGTDLMGRIGWAVEYNQTLKTSREWTHFLRDFILENQRFGDTVKSRLLSTIEDVKESHVKGMLETLIARGASDRIKGNARNILEKNFGVKIQVGSGQSSSAPAASSASE